MLTVRSEQMEVLSKEGVRSFARSLASDLGGPQSDIQEAVDEGLALGLSSEEQLRRFALCRLRHGTGFPRGQSWTRAIVDDAVLTPVQMLEKLEAGPTDEVLR